MRLPRLTGRAARPTITAVLALGFAAGAAAPASANVNLRQKPDAAGCVSENPGAGCAPGRALGGVESIVVSPDGRSAYAASYVPSAVSVFDRAADGTLTQKAGTSGCIAAANAAFGLAPGTCAAGTGLQGAHTVAISPDGRNVYVGSFLDDTVAVFDRAADGRLTQKPGLAGCVSETGAGPCADGNGLAYVVEVTVSADGKNVYAGAGNSHALAVFDRLVDGTLTQKAGAAGCFSETGAGPCTTARGLVDVTGVTASADGTSVYAISGGGASIAVFDRAPDGTLSQKAGLDGCISESTTGGVCAFGKALRYPRSIKISPDGTSVYVAASGSGAVAVFDRAPGGALTQKAGSAGCLASSGGCTPGRQLSGASSVTVSPDGANAYVATSALDVNEQLVGLVAILDRAPDGTLSQPAGVAGCVSETGSSGACVDANAVEGAASVALSPDGSNAYVAALPIDAVAVFDRGDFPLSPPPPPPPPPVTDRTRPALRSLALTPVRFRVRAGRLAAAVAGGGSNVSFRLTEPAAVRFRVQRVVAGRRAGGRCVAVRRSNRSARRCDRYRLLPSGFAYAGVQGPNTLPFSGRLGNRRLAAGRYRLRAVATDAAGNRSRAKVARFEIRR